MNAGSIDGDETTDGGDNPLLAGRYRVLKRLGQGGMGSVWLAEDTLLDGKLFALKMLPSILVSNGRAYRQLKDEALVAMKLSHPNIVTLRAFEENNGNPFLVMDYVDGQTLDELIASKGRLSDDETARVLGPVAAALDYARSEGVIHRDVKPANVMIRKDGHPYILDFGIAREVKESLTQITGKSPSGTPRYMSPEQLRGEAPAPAQDVYSFAATAYECLSGEAPFSRGQIEYLILHEKPKPLDAVGRFSHSVMQGLEKNPARRPGSCKDVLSARTSGPKSASSGGPEHEGRIPSGPEEPARSTMRASPPPGPASRQDAPYTVDRKPSYFRVALFTAIAVAALLILLLAKLGVPVLVGLGRKSAVESAVDLLDGVGKTYANASSVLNDEEGSNAKQAAESINKDSIKFLDEYRGLNADDLKRNMFQKRYELGK